MVYLFNLNYECLLTTVSQSYKLLNHNWGLFIGKEAVIRRKYTAIIDPTASYIYIGIIHK